jgi:O-antigen/teichoic acid export membrane protein
MKIERESDSQKFFSDVVWQGVSQVLMSLTGIVVLPALTKGYSSEMYGIWSQINATSSLLGLVLTLEFGTSIIRFLAAEENRYERSRALGTMLGPVFVFIAIVMALALLFGDNLSVFIFGDSKYASFVSLTFILASTDSFFTLLLSYLRARRHIKTLAITRLAFAVTRMIVILVLSSNGVTFGWLVGILIIMEAIFAAIIFFMITRDTGLPHFGITGLSRYLSFSLPQIPSGALAWIMNSSDRYFITHFLDVTQTGIYSASSVLGTAISFLSWPISFVLFPTVSKLWEQGEIKRVKRYFEYSVKLLLVLSVPAAGGLYILSQPLLRLLSTSEFTVGGLLVLLIALGTLFEGIFGINQYIIYLVKKTAWLPLLAGIGAILNASINITLIPRIGIIGAAIANIVAFFVLTAIVTIWARKIIGYELDWKFVIKVVLSSAIMSTCLWYIKINSILGIVLAVISGIVIYGLVLFLLRAFSKEDRRLMWDSLRGMMTVFKSN